MKVLVTGGFGFIGSWIVKSLEEKGAKVFIWDNFSSADFNNLPEFKGELIVGDILETDILKKIPRLDAIVHEAAITDTTLKDDSLMFKVNYEGFKNILKHCISKKIKLVYASSAGVYGDGPMPAKETQRPHPLNSYSFSKYLCDRLVLSLKGLKNKTIVGLRYFNVYGPGEAHKKSASSMIYQLYLQMRNNRSPRIFKFGQQKRDFIYVKDVARITLKALEFKGRAILNVGTGMSRSFNEIIQILNQNLKTNFSPEYFDNPYQGRYQEFTQ
ncbi:MAG: NAD-dependent epimerase/dehydratase family protein, partial [Candidatus Omnitrophica bacterium]|nr:NAD-dependent epimerase/dehydratase family protein [Candidatus Omnitrophota bacterium]